MRFVTDEIIEEGALDINITPLIDIVFLLLIFFMVSTTFVETRGIDVKLPTSSAARQRDVAKSVVVSMNQQGAIFLENKRLSFEELEQHLLDLVKASPASTLVVRADRGAEHGQVVRVLDLAKQKGVAKIAIATAVGQAGEGKDKE